MSVTAVSAVDLAEISFVGSELRRPECVLATATGDVFTSNWDGGVSRITPAGVHVPILANGNGWLRPNGIAIRQSGSFLLAHLGEDGGGVFELLPDGFLTDFLLEVDRVSLPPTNFVTEDHLGRTWITVSTKQRPRAEGYRPDVADGFIVLVDELGARIVADGLGYTNEAQLNPSGSHLYVNETFGRRLTRFPIGEAGTLGEPELVAEFGSGTFPDGLVFDAEGCVWITSVISNRVIRVDRHGNQTVIVEDVSHDHLDEVEVAFLNGELGRRHLDSVTSSRLSNISSLCFGGPDLRTVYLGCLLGDSIATFRSPVAGVKPVHWSVRVPDKF